MTRLAISRDLVAQILAHVDREKPVECCGFLAGSGSTASTIIPLVNASATPQSCFESSPESTFEAHREMKRLGLQIVAIYHSHPTTDVTPSRRDRELHYANDVPMLIVSSPTKAMRAWQVIDGNVVGEVELAIS